MTAPITSTAIHEAAEMIRDKYWPSGDVPVDIDWIVEKMGIDIVPLASLREHGVDAYVSENLSAINVDLEYGRSDKMNATNTVNPANNGCKLPT